MIKFIDLNDKILTKLYSLNVEIFSEEDISQDIVQTLRTEKKMPNYLGDIDKHLLLHTIEELNHKNPDEIRDLRFPIGGINPEDLINVQNQLEYFRKLTKNFKQINDSILKSQV